MGPCARRRRLRLSRGRGRGCQEASGTRCIRCIRGSSRRRVTSTGTLPEREVAGKHNLRLPPCVPDHTASQGLVRGHVCQSAPVLRSRLHADGNRAALTTSLHTVLRDSKHHPARLLETCAGKHTGSQGPSGGRVCRCSGSTYAVALSTAASTCEAIVLRRSPGTSLSQWSHGMRALGSLGWPRVKARRWRTCRPCEAGLL